jgi:hypothetical protein
MYVCFLHPPIKFFQSKWANVKYETMDYRESVMRFDPSDKTLQRWIKPFLVLKTWCWNEVRVARVVKWALSTRFVWNGRSKSQGSFIFASWQGTCTIHYSHSSYSVWQTWELEQREPKEQRPRMHLYDWILKMIEYANSESKSLFFYDPCVER